MKTNVTETSIDCYHGHIAGAKEIAQANRVADVVRKVGGKVTRRQVASIMEMETGTVSARVNKLVESGTLLDGGDHDRIRCPITGKRVRWICHKDNMAGVTVDMFGGLQ
jgi:hypothetical protein